VNIEYILCPHNEQNISLVHFALKDLKKIEEMKKNRNYLMLIYRRNGANNDAVIKESLRIDCGYLVRSVNFSLIANLQKSTAFWPRTAQYKDFFLITGHSSGRIRLWDVLSGNSLIIQ